MLLEEISPLVGLATVAIGLIQILRLAAMMVGTAVEPRYRAHIQAINESPVALSWVPSLSNA